MAITATDNKLRFLSGKSSALANVPFTLGNVYVTTDEHIMYADVGTKRLRLSDIVMVDTLTDLPTYPPEEQKTALYYVRNGNILCCYNQKVGSNGNAGQWTQINSAPTLENIIKSSATTYSVVDSKAQAKFSLYDKNDTDVTEGFKLLISSGQTETVGVTANDSGIVITAADTVTHNDLSVAAASNVATITLAEKVSGYNANGTAKEEEVTNHQIKLSNQGGVKITANGDQINLAATPTAVTHAFDTSGAFSTTITMPDGDDIKSSTITPIIKYGVGAAKSTATFVSGTATLSDVYTKTEVDNAITEKLEAANAMVFRGPVGGTTQLPVASAGVGIGDTYIVNTAGIIKDTGGTTINSNAKVGDLFIANSNDAESDGSITGTIQWVYVPAGNDDLYSYDVAASNSGFVITQYYGNDDEEAGVLNVGAGLVGVGSGHTLTISHPEDNVSETTGTATLTNGKTQTFNAISEISWDDYGHVSGVKTTTYSVANHTVSQVAFAASATTDSTTHVSTATITNTVSQTSGVQESGSFSIESSSLKATAAGSKVTVDLVWYEFT